MTSCTRSALPDRYLRRHATHKGTTEVAGNVSGVNQAAAETGTASTRVLEAAGGLAEQSEVLCAEVDKFLAEVRSM